VALSSLPLPVTSSIMSSFSFLSAATRRLDS
jgi:hypothetical protein